MTLVARARQSPRPSPLRFGNAAVPRHQTQTPRHASVERVCLDCPEGHYHRRKLCTLPCTPERAKGCLHSLGTKRQPGRTCKTFWKTCKTVMCADLLSY